MKNMRVLLINPPAKDGRAWVREGRCQQFDIWGAPFPPLSLAYMKTQIRDIADVLVIDSEPAGMTLEQVLSRIKAFAPDIMIMSVATPTFNSDCNWFAPQIKAIFPDLRIGATGIHVTALPIKSLESSRFLDFVIKGEPECSLRHILLTYGKEGTYDAKGLCARNGEVIVDNPVPQFVEDLDSYGLPDWDDINFNNYVLPIKNRPFSLVSVARGCPYSCSYCAAHAYYGKRKRYRSVRSILEEIDDNLSRGVRDFLFWTEMICDDGPFLHQLLEALIRGDYHKRIHWVCNARVDQISREMLEKMKRSGCWQIALGLEFGTDKALAIAKKGGTASVALARKVVEWADQAGLAVDGHFILGFPGETEQDMEQTIRFAVSLPLTFAHFYSAAPFPGSKLYEDTVEKYKLEQRWDSILQNKYVFTEEGLNDKQVYSLISKAYRKFYLSRYRAWKISRIAGNWHERYHLIREGTRFTRDLLVGMRRLSPITTGAKLDRSVGPVFPKQDPVRPDVGQW